MSEQVEESYCLTKDTTDVTAARVKSFSPAQFITFRIHESKIERLFTRANLRELSDQFCGRAPHTAGYKFFTCISGRVLPEIT